jgi:hypothetical protein
MSAGEPIDDLTVGSFAIFPRERLRGYERGPASHGS